jgi:hypothetical protein
MFTLAWQMLTRWPIFFEPAYDRVSIVHAAVLAVGVAAILSAMGLSRAMPRALALVLAGAAAASAIAMLYPQFFLGPWPHLDPAVKAWHRQIGELKPLLPDNLVHLGQFLGAFAASLIALPLAVYRLRHGAAGERLVMLTALCGFCLFGALSLVQMRWSGEMQAVMLLPWTLTTRRIMQSSIALKLPHGRVPLRSGLLMTALFLQITPAAVAGTVPSPGPVATAACDWDEVVRALGRLPDQHGTVMTELWYGPDILWRSHFDVVGAPYEIAPAIADSAQFQNGTIAERRAILEQRHIDYVLSCGAAAGAQALGLTSLTFGVPGFHFYRVVH